MKGEIEMLQGEYLLRSLSKLEESKHGSAITTLFAILCVQEGIISRGKFAEIVGIEDRCDIDDYLEKNTDWELWGVTLPNFSLNKEFTKTFEYDVPYPICPFSVYFDGDEDKCDVGLCDYDLDFRECTHGCEKLTKL
jgi:hypothetical protein